MTAKASHRNSFLHIPASTSLDKVWEERAKVSLNRYLTNKRRQENSQNSLTDNNWNIQCLHKADSSRA